MFVLKVIHGGGSVMIWAALLLWVTNRSFMRGVPELEQ